MIVNLVAVLLFVLVTDVAGEAAQLPAVARPTAGSARRSGRRSGRLLPPPVLRASSSWWGFSAILQVVG
jgi:hypothetical protein